VIQGAELIIDEPMAARAQRFFGALRDAAPRWVTVSRHYTGKRRTIVTYGAGASWRQAFLRQHKAAGGRAILFDLAYWDRVDSLRMSLDGLHPTAEHLHLAAGLPSRRSFALREDANPAGYILLVGLGRKTAQMLGEAPQAWERSKLREIRERWPGARIVWRPKRDPVSLDGLPMLHSVPIDVALNGARAVVCRASNVAVDACVAGVPVWCEGGAALALYGDNHAPTPRQRAEFLHTLSWWEWRKDEPAAAWEWVRWVVSMTGGGA
jgi:hypothetical protein